MTYLFLYVVGLFIIWYVYRFGWLETLKTIISVVIPSFFIILLNIKAGRLLFKNPIIGLSSLLPTSVFIYRTTKPLVYILNNWLINKFNKEDFQDQVIDTESIPVDE